jgi:hypothetical protein
MHRGRLRPSRNVSCETIVALTYFFAKTITGFDILTNILTLRFFYKNTWAAKHQGCFLLKNLWSLFRNILLCKIWDTVYHGFLEYLDCVAFIVSHETIVALTYFFTKTITGFDILTNILTLRVFCKNAWATKHQGCFLPKKPIGF